MKFSWEQLYDKYIGSPIDKAIASVAISELMASLLENPSLKFLYSWKDVSKRSH